MQQLGWRDEVWQSPSEARIQGQSVQAILQVTSILL
jgi:hypothetical protein